MMTLEPKHALYDSVESMLAPETLSELLSQPVTHVELQPLGDHGGVAGSRLSYVQTDAGRFVLKRMSLEHDWNMYASEDVNNRSLRVWQYGLLDRMSPYLQHKIISCAENGTGAAVLMHDLTDHVLDDDSSTPLDVVLVFLDTLARHHATFWNDPLLHDARLGLCDTAKWLGISSLPLARKHPGEQRGFLPGWVREGWRLMEEELDHDVFRQFSRLRENPQPLLDRLAHYPKTLLHGDYASRNLAYLAPDPVVFDWQVTGPGLMTTDLIWFVDNQRESIEPDRAIRYYRGCLEEYLGYRFHDTEWQAMVRLGGLVVALMMTCFPVFLSHVVEEPERRAFYEREVREHSRRIRDSIQWLNGAVS
jgi:hypothetical protein